MTLLLNDNFCVNFSSLFSAHFDYKLDWFLLCRLERSTFICWRRFYMILILSVKYIVVFINKKNYFFGGTLDTFSRNLFSGGFSVGWAKAAILQWRFSRILSNRMIGILYPSALHLLNNFGIGPLTAEICAFFLFLVDDWFFYFENCQNCIFPWKKIMQCLFVDIEHLCIWK